MRNVSKLLLMILIVSISFGGVGAQDEPEVVATGLNAPRHVFYGGDGTLYIAEAGAGGDTTAVGAAGTGDVSVGFTAAVTSVTPDGEQVVSLDGLFSTADPFGYVEGVSALYVTDEYFWLVMGQGPSRESAPEGAVFSALVQIDRATGDIVNTVDLLAFEEENNPDGTQDVASNPQDIAVAEDGTIYVVDASGNTLLRYTEANGLELFTVWEVDDTGQTPSPVPTSVVIAPDGSLYVGFLSGYPFLPGGARIEHWSADGELLNVIEGLTLVTDLEIGQDRSLYAVQFADGFGDQGFNPNSGSVVQVSEDGTITPIIEGLNYPYGIAQADDGSWVVTVNAAFSEPGSGEVLRITAPT